MGSTAGAPGTAELRRAAAAPVRGPEGASQRGPDGAHLTPKSMSVHQTLPTEVCPVPCRAKGADCRREPDRVGARVSSAANARSACTDSGPLRTRQGDLGRHSSVSTDGIVRFPFSPTHRENLTHLPVFQNDLGQWVEVSQSV